MSYRNLVSCHVSDAVRVDFFALAKSRDMTVASMLRQMIVREINMPQDWSREHHNHILFVAIAMDGLLEAHPDPELRPRLIDIWRERIEREESRRGD